MGNEAGFSLDTAPVYIWKTYVDYLWNYQSNSWVARIAYTFRVLAILLILPIVLLTLLDITSYVIARTLGIVDAVKASTSDTDAPLRTDMTPSVPPSILISTPLSDSISSLGQSSMVSKDPSELDVSHPQAYFTSEEHNLKLSGVGVFSPASSQPPSPTISRRKLKGEAEGASLRQRTKHDDIAE